MWAINWEKRLSNEREAQLLVVDSLVEGNKTTSMEGYDEWGL